jgi:hypothetical protein
MKFRRLAAAVALTVSLAASPTWADGQQPIPSPRPDSMVSLLIQLVGYGIEFSTELL